MLQNLLTYLFLKVRRNPNFYSFHKNSMACDRNTNPIPLEAALTLDMQAMLSTLSRERFQFNTVWRRERNFGLFTNNTMIRFVFD